MSHEDILVRIQERDIQLFWDQFQPMAEKRDSEELKIPKSGSQF